MYKKLVTYHFVIFSTLCVLVLFYGKAFSAESPTPASSPSYLIEDLLANISADSITIRINGNTAPAYTSYTKFDPLRLIVDIAGVKFDKKVDVGKLIPDNEFVKLSVSTITERKPPITSLIFKLKEGYESTVEREGNDIIVKVTPAAAMSSDQKSKSETSAQVAKMAMGPATKEMQKNQQKAGNSETSSKGAEVAVKDKAAPDATLDELIGSSVAALKEKQKTSSASSQALDRATSLEDPFASAGYTKQRISVDFYKIDIHNVFRLFRQISDMNLIIDEGVRGSVTIALNNVPWDFALDIICNLSGLKKEERFNTIVIYPKSKSIKWPTSPLDSLSIKTDKKVIQQEALIVQQTLNESKEITKSKKLIKDAQRKEQAEDYEDASDLYHKAFILWPKNDRLADKLAALNLVNLHMNAKAVYYAKESLKLKPKNDYAALLAAIASANMHRLSEATEYFNRSVSGSPPLKSALLSYAAFNENFDHPEAALKLITKYSKLYGDTLETMLAQARLYDKVGNSEKALAQYRSILLSGFQLRPDLKKYIQGRLQAGKL